MASKRSKGIHQPFEGLDRLISRKAMPLAHTPAGRSNAAPDKPSSPRRDAELFAREMSDVVPVACNLYWRLPQNMISPAPIEDTAQTDNELNALCLLVETGHGFEVSQTPEYMEAHGPGVQPGICRRLHSGHFAIQDHVDLHGLTVPEAEETLNAFIRKAIDEGKRAVLVVHGRGLSSPGEPVLKNCVYRWLTTGRWMRYVTALTSARGCDGGAGATYVLLRRRPQSKRLRKIALQRQADGH